MTQSTSKIIEEIKLRGNLPQDGDFLYKNDLDILILLNAVLHNEIFPLYIENEPSYLLAFEDFPIGTKRTFLIPPNAHNRRLYEVQLITSSGQEINVPFLPFGSQGYHAHHQAGMRIIHNTIHLLGYQHSINSMNLRLYYHRKSFPLVLDHQAISLSQSFNYQEKQRFRIPLPLVGGLNSLPYQTGDPVVLQNTLDPMELLTDHIAYLISPNEIALQKTEENSQFRYDSSYQITAAGTVNIPPLPDTGCELLILRTLMSMALSTETRFRIRDQLKSQERLFHKSLKKRVRLETPVKAKLSALWHDG